MLGLHTWMEHEFKDLVAKIATAGCLYPPMLVFRALVLVVLKNQIAIFNTMNNKIHAALVVP